MSERDARRIRAVRTVQVLALLMCAFGAVVALLYGKRFYGPEIAGTGVALVMAAEWFRTDR